MTAVMVTGATTPIGDALLRALIARADTDPVLAVGHEADALAWTPHGRLRYAAADLTRARDLRDLIHGPARELGIRVLVHNAIHRSPALGDAAHRLDVEATDNLLRLVAEHPTIRRFVFLSHAEVYRAGPALIGEERPLELSPRAPQWIRDRVEADLLAVGRMGRSALEVVVLRAAECLAPGAGSQLHAFLAAPSCHRLLGFDPMINVASVDDVVRAIVVATDHAAQGVFNIPGKDTLPLSVAIARAGGAELALPGPLVRALCALRGSALTFAISEARLRFGCVLDGGRARDVLGFEPTTAVDWPRAFARP